MRGKIRIDPEKIRPVRQRGQSWRQIAIKAEDDRCIVVILSEAKNLCKSMLRNAARQRNT